MTIHPAPSIGIPQNGSRRRWLIPLAGGVLGAATLIGLVAKGVREVRRAAEVSVVT